MSSLFRKILVMGIVALFLGPVGSVLFKVNMLAYGAGAVYIRDDGSVEGTTFIESIDNITYVFTADISDCDYMYVQRSNIIVDGNGHLLNSSGAPEDGISVMFVNNVTIKNISVQGFGFGIYLYDAANNTISDNTVAHNYYGIGLNSCWNNTISGNTVTGNNESGIYLYSSSNRNSLSGNNITAQTYDGIYLESSSDNNVSGNYIASNSRYGILLQSSSNSTLSRNNITANNDVGIRLDGSSSNNVISGNAVGNSPNEHIELLYSSNNNTISGNMLANSTADVGVYVYACSLNSFFGNNMTSNANSGIRIDSSSDSTISENSISENLNGVYLAYSYNITVSGNNITANNASGIVLDNSNNNHIYHNNFINNTVQAEAASSISSWDDGYPSGGNYWSDYNGKDQYEGPSQNIPGNDTIGDTPYEVNVNNTDRYPLMAPYEPLRRLFLESEGQWNMGEATDIEVWSVFALDVDDDGAVEIMTCAQVNQSAELRIYGYNGLAVTLDHSELWQTDGDTRAWSVFASDVDSDGVTEMLVGAEAKGQVFGQLRIWNWNGTTLTLEHSEEWQTVSWTHVYSVFAADIDDDGVTEIITGGDAFNGANYNNQLRIWNWNGTALTLESSTEWSTGGGASVQSVCAFDVDSDSTVEIVTAGQDNSVAQLCIWNWNGTVLTLEHGEEWATLGSSWGRVLSVFASDIDNDGTAEIVTGGETYVSSDNSQLRVWNWNGSTLALETNIDWPLNGTDAYAWTICDGDVDRDGLAEVMTAGTSGYYSAQLRVWSFNGSTLKLDANQESLNEQADTVFACDADGDGTIEIMTAGVTYDAIYSYEQIKIWSFPESVPPTITILSPQNKTYSTSTVALTFTVDESASWLGYSLDGQPNATISGNTTLPLLLDGSHNVIVHANDTFGNMGMSMVYFTVDTAEPNITNVVQDPLTDILSDTVVRINATVTDVTSGIKQVLLNCTFTNSTDTWYAVFSMTHLAGDIWNGTILALPYGTNVTYVIVAEDGAGNSITSEQIYGIKYEYPVVPEFPLPTVFLAFVIATVLLTVAVKKKRRCTQPPNFNFPFFF